MTVYFENTKNPCIVNKVTEWHVEHGWLWNVRDVRANRNFAVFFCSLLCGDGCVCHFSTVKNVKISPVVLLAALRKGLRMIEPFCSVIFATVPAKKAKLIRVLIRLGFGLTEATYLRDGQEIILLQYFFSKKTIVKEKTKSKKGVYHVN